ncbi:MULTISPECIES: aminoacyl-tRNA hydrolase [unclassified Halomonas]|uniref:aminoacyl-tRNA hydrolase n=1 Tax=unclassified Halomonas TaxID=2609666 RepID=UPI0006DAAD92|nr:MULTISPECIES: aminoacyl-tRNA hydrolase [unclassified Halomonas]KPQ23673.1 MAG: aminoacyl-tRNA hydrolase [Halomonas sp. HL-93]SBR47572.1 peptidyl-tRNA hydrolase [Halomonas sp. HL-93]SNY99279.1 peptidyl-tRNA hydrolase [Halomonas sp. hl-4]
MSQVTAIIGLGNPGANYEATRHNAGFWLVDAIARSTHGELRPEKKFLGHYAKVRVGDHELHLLNPTTFMNRSGAAVAALCQFFKLTPDNLLVAHDELDLPPGQARYKTGGGHGGHNGLRDIISALGNQKQFHRVRIGIGHPGDASQVTNYVLGRAGKAEQTAIERAIDECLATLPSVLAGDWAKAMNQLHSLKP